MTKDKKKVVAIILAIIAGIVFVSTLISFFYYRNTLQKEVIRLGEERSKYKDAHLIPEIDWGEMESVFNISDVHLKKKDIEPSLTNTSRYTHEIVCDIEAKQIVQYPVYMARFLNVDGMDVMRAKAVILDSNQYGSNLEEWQPGFKGKAYFDVNKKKLLAVKVIKITKRIR